jgi:AhpD family alkylhydroperoxidase
MEVSPTPMTQRLDIFGEAPDAYEAMTALDGSVDLDEKLRVLVKLRASMVNGCVHCIDLHSREGRTTRESDQRLFGVAAWEESPYFDARERAALALTDAITLIADGRVPDAVWEQARDQFDSRELAELVWTITVINAWNRIAISTRIPPAG